MRFSTFCETSDSHLGVFSYICNFEFAETFEFKVDSSGREGGRGKEGGWRLGRRLGGGGGVEE
jgi:hypothetical protein